ncbi:MAG: hypothetical protein M3N52_13630 [Actinomycetota bacterium]|nr:hypothetical protein [Actinomycetota bacterium]
MATVTADRAVRDYLVALKDLAALRDQDQLSELQRQLEESTDPVKRLQLRQELLELESPSLQRYEDDFVAHAKNWADEHEVGPDAFAAEGVPASVLRRAGFRVGGRRHAGVQRRPAARAGRGRRRVSADEIRAAIPKGPFTARQLQERSGASAAVVRRVLQEEVAAGRVNDQGTDPDHRGPGRAPTLYQAA